MEEVPKIIYSFLFYVWIIPLGLAILLFCYNKIIKNKSKQISKISNILFILFILFFILYKWFYYKNFYGVEIINQYSKSHDEGEHKTKLKREQNLAGTYIYTTMRIDSNEMAETDRVYLRQILDTIKIDVIQKYEEKRLRIDKIVFNSPILNLKNDGRFTIHDSLTNNTTAGEWTSQSRNMILLIFDDGIYWDWNVRKYSPPINLSSTLYGTKYRLPLIYYWVKKSN